MFDGLLIDVMIVSFLLEFLDVYAGMGFGIITPVLLILGYSVFDIIPAVLFLSCIFGLSAGFFHHYFKNISLNDSKVRKRILTTIVFGLLGIAVGALLALQIPMKILEIYIGILIFTIGVVVLVNKKNGIFSSRKLVFLSLLAGFNKGMSGGGFGPVLTSGQILSGIMVKKSVSITALTEGSISLLGFLIYLFFSGIAMNWNLTLSMLFGGGLALVPAVYSVKLSKLHYMKNIVGISSIILGLLTLLRVINPMGWH